MRPLIWVPNILRPAMLLYLSLNRSLVRLLIIPSAQHCRPQPDLTETLTLTLTPTKCRSRTLGHRWVHTTLDIHSGKGMVPGGNEGQAPLRIAINNTSDTRRSGIRAGMDSEILIKVESLTNVLSRSGAAQLDNQAGVPG